MHAQKNKRGKMGFSYFTTIWYTSMDRGKYNLSDDVRHQNSPHPPCFVSCMALTAASWSSLLLSPSGLRLQVRCINSTLTTLCWVYLLVHSHRSLLVMVPHDTWTNLQPFTFCTSSSFRCSWVPCRRRASRSPFILVLQELTSSL